MKKWTESSALRFLLVGVGNTLLSMAISLGLYNLLGVAPVAASAAAYLAGAVMSFFLNRYFTFHSREGFWRSAFKFAVNVAVLWAVTTPFLQPRLAGAFFAAGLGEKTGNNVATLLCMGLYTVLNYFGQRFFAFRKSGGEV